MKIDPASTTFIIPGIYPYLGGSVAAGQLKSIVRTYGGAVVSGRRGALLAADVPGALVDPAQYGPQTVTESDTLFDFDDWLERQHAANVPVVLTDTPRIPNRDPSALRKALGRWEMLDEPVLVVLPIEPWWLKAGLGSLVEEVRAAGRPVAIVLLHQYNGLDAADAIGGLLTFVSAVGTVPVILLRSDISAIGAVAHGGSAGFVGWSPSTRHGPLPMRPSTTGEDDVKEKDESPGVFVPALHDYFKASKLPALARCRRKDLLRCDDECCGERSLLRIAQLSEVDVRAARNMASEHNMISTELVARRIFSATEPRDAWWETCKGAAVIRASLVGDGISLPESRWLRQWLEAGSPSHDPETVR